MNIPRDRRLSLTPLRAFDAVARHLNFRAAAEELHLSQPAVSRQIRGLEDELGSVLFSRGTRHVALTGAGDALLKSVGPWLRQLDATVARLRQATRRQPVGVTTFASFASLWLLPRLAGFQAANPEIDIRISAADTLAPLDDPELDLGLRYVHRDAAPQGSTPLFGELLTPVASPELLRRTPLRKPADLARHTLLEEDDHRPSAQFLSWHHWLQRHAPPKLQPRGWVYLNFTYQQIQQALAGQGVALARVPLVHESLARGELVEPFGAAGRVPSPFGYWLVRWPARQERPALAAFERWVLEQAALTRAATGEDTGEDTGERTAASSLGPASRSALR
jgi:LysR family glycine cleavage system transcriptional activator